MSHEFINEPVDVLVAFHENRVVPKRMRWNSREYEIRSVNLVHTAREGAKRVFYFSVSDLTNYFKLKLDPEFLEWQLVETYTDG
jgi:ribosomal protein L24E